MYMQILNVFPNHFSLCEPYPHDSCIYSYQKHEPSGFCLYLKGLDVINKFYNPIVYTKQSDDEGISKIFVEKLEAITNKIYKDYNKKQKPLKLTTQEQEEFDKAEICHICEKEFYEDDSTGKMLRSKRPLSFYWKVSWSST